MSAKSREAEEEGDCFLKKLFLAVLYALAFFSLNINCDFFRSTMVVYRCG